MAIEVLPSDTLLECLEAHRHELGGQGINLFRLALDKSTSPLLDDFIRPNLVIDDSAYIYIAQDNGGKGGRPHFDPKNSILASEHAFEFPGSWGLFTNPLSWIAVDAPGPKPSERATNIGCCIYTNEFDKLSLREQLCIIYGGGLRRTDKILQCFKDYRGYEVVYGGRKSLHFHFVFDLRHWKRDLAFAGNSAYQDNWRADFPDAFLREAYQDRWWVIAKAFRLGTGVESNADPSLRFWEQNRRMPLALRRIAEGHPLDLPAGMYVRQYVLASSIRRHVPKAGKSWLHFDRLISRFSRRSPVRSRPAATNNDSGSPRPLQQSAPLVSQPFDNFLAQNFSKLTAGSSGLVALKLFRLSAQDRADIVALIKTGRVDLSAFLVAPGKMQAFGELTEVARTDPHPP